MIVRFEKGETADDDAAVIQEGAGQRTDGDRLVVDGAGAGRRASGVVHPPVATAAAGEFLAINAFDQPGVEEGKLATFALMGREGYEKKAEEMKAAKKEDESLKFVF